MRRIFSNGGNKDFVINPFRDLVAGSSRLYLAAPYFDFVDPILEANRRGKPVQLLVGLNGATSPKAIADVHELPGIAIRYLTRRFHAKIYLSDKAALIGSSNLTDAGLRKNREAVICLDRHEDADAVDEIQGLFLELWDAGQVLTKEKVDAFRETYRRIKPRRSEEDRAIEDAVGKAEPPNIRVFSDKISSRQKFLEELRQQVYEQYLPAFNEVRAILEGQGFRRKELVQFGIAHETNRFLSYVRSIHVIGDNAWQGAPILDQEGQREKTIRFAQEWVGAADNKVVPDYADRLENVSHVFGTSDALDQATKKDMTEGLMALHAFSEQLRFVRGGGTSLRAEFWKWNNNDVAGVKSTLRHLLYGSGDFIERLHDVLHDPHRKLAHFGRFCAIELYGTVKPDECPPMNGRIAKALRFLGFDVKGE